MKAILFTFLLFPFLASADARLIGTWKSDAKLTSKFIDEKVNWPTDQVDALKQLFGFMTITFDGENVVAGMKDHEVVANGKSHKLVGFNEKSQYRVLGSDDDSVAVESVEPVTGRNNIITYHFVNEDLMWIYVPDSGDLDAHLREYFVRVK